MEQPLRPRWYREAEGRPFTLVDEIPTGTSRLSIAARLALALTDVCCERKQGRVGSLKPEKVQDTDIVTGLLTILSAPEIQRGYIVGDESFFATAASDLFRRGSLVEIRTRGLAEKGMEMAIFEDL